VCVYAYCRRHVATAAHMTVCGVLRCGGCVQQCVAVCCNVMQCVAMCCSVLQCGAARCSMVQRVAV